MTGPQSPTADRVPVKSDGIETEVVDGEVLLYHPRQTRAVYLNPTAALIWGLCDGQRTVRDIIAAVAESYPDDRDKLSDDVLATIDQLQESGVLLVH